jgi:tetratricopeptide (TPR) repeat protein
MSRGEAVTGVPGGVRFAAAAAAGARALVRHLLASVAVAAAVTATCADPYNERLLAEGTAALQSGQPRQAIELLRRACFGLLDSPPRLAGCLAQLAVAQREAEDAAGLRETIERLAAIEDRFGALTAAGLDPELERDLESAVREALPEAALADMPAFAHLVPSQVERLAALQPRERRRELEGLAAAEPSEPQWQIMLAELELEQGEARRARRRLEAAALAAPDDAAIQRRLGLLAADEGRWQDAASHLQAAEAPGDVDSARARLAALLALGEVDEAAAVAGALPGDLAADPNVAALAKRAVALAADPPREPAAPAEQPPMAESSAAGHLDPPAEVVPEAAAAPGPAEAPAAAEASAAGGARAASLERVRELLHSGRVREAALLAFDSANAAPEDVEAQLLAAEAAYCAALFNEALAYFGRAGGAPDGRVDLQFYEAVTLYETGNPEAASGVLRGCLPKLRRTPFVDSYVVKILGGQP